MSSDRESGRNRNLLGKCAGAFAIALCALSFLPAQIYAFPWDIDMFQGPPVQPLAVAPRVMPAQTLPIHGEPPKSTVASIRLANPLSPAPKILQHGGELFYTQCSPCHGKDGKGDGPVKFLLRVPAADLTGEAVRDAPNGFIYGTIRNGTIAMPSYGDALAPDERWQVVLYIRDLEPRGESPGHQQTGGEERLLAGRLVPVAARAREGLRASLAAKFASAKKQFRAFCVKCHGMFGRGDGPVAPVLDQQPADFTDCERMSKISDELLFKAIKDGGQAIGKSTLMVAWREGLSDNEIRDLVRYVRSFCAQQKNRR